VTIASGEKRGSHDNGALSILMRPQLDKLLSLFSQLLQFGDKVLNFGVSLV